MTRVFIFGLIAAALGAYLAEKQGRNWLLWGLLCAVFPLTLVVLLILPPVQGKVEARGCPACGMPVHPGDTVCRHCGKTTPIEMIKCPICGKYVPEDSHCSECGARLS